MIHGIALVILVVLISILIVLVSNYTIGFFMDTDMDIDMERIRDKVTVLLKHTLLKKPYKLCKDCIYFDMLPGDLSPLCNREKEKVAHLNLVNGIYKEKEKATHYYCDEERTFSGECGVRGKYYKAQL